MPTPDIDDLANLFNELKPTADKWEKVNRLHDEDEIIRSNRERRFIDKDHQFVEAYYKRKGNPKKPRIYTEEPELKPVVADLQKVLNDAFGGEFKSKFNIPIVFEDKDNPILANNQSGLALGSPIGLKDKKGVSGNRRLIVIRKPENAFEMARLRTLLLHEVAHAEANMGHAEFREKMKTYEGQRYIVNRIVKGDKHGELDPKPGTEEFYKIKRLQDKLMIGDTGVMKKPTKTTAGDILNEVNSLFKGLINKEGK